MYGMAVDIQNNFVSQLQCMLKKQQLYDKVSHHEHVRSNLISFLLVVHCILVFQFPSAIIEYIQTTNATYKQHISLLIPLSPTQSTFYISLVEVHDFEEKIQLSKRLGQ